MIPGIGQVVTIGVHLPVDIVRGQIIIGQLGSQGGVSVTMRCDVHGKGGHVVKVVHCLVAAGLPVGVEGVDSGGRVGCCIVTLFQMLPEAFNSKGI